MNMDMKITNIVSPQVVKSRRTSGKNKGGFGNHYSSSRGTHFSIIEDENYVIPIRQEHMPIVPYLSFGTNYSSDSILEKNEAEQRVRRQMLKSANWIKASPQIGLKGENLIFPVDDKLRYKIVGAIYG